MSDGIRAWVNGQRVDEDAALPALDHGITVGDGVFETVKVVDGTPFALTRHHDRMDRSLAGLGLPALDRERLNIGVKAVLAGEPISLGRLRYTVTGGRGPLGSDRYDSEPTYIVAAAEMTPPAPVTTVAVVPWTRNERAATAGLKTTSYAENVIALAAAKRVGASEALFGNSEGRLCEGTGSNVFVVRGGVILTPPLSAGPLAGVTRGLVVEWAQEEGLEVREEELLLETLMDCDEAFLSSTTRDVQAVGALRVAEQEQREVGRHAALPVHDRDLGEAPGPVTSRVAEVFRRLGAERHDP